MEWYLAVSLGWALSVLVLKYSIYFIRSLFELAKLSTVETLIFHEAHTQWNRAFLLDSEKKSKYRKMKMMIQKKESYILAPNIFLSHVCVWFVHYFCSTYWFFSLLKFQLYFISKCSSKFAALRYLQTVWHFIKCLIKLLLLLFFLQSFAAFSKEKYIKMVRKMRLFESESIICKSDMISIIIRFSFRHYGRLISKGDFNL